MKYLTKKVREEAYRALERASLIGSAEEKAEADAKMSALFKGELSKEAMLELAAEEREYVSLNK